MRISDWSSDVCSSDLAVDHGYQDPEADLEGASPAVGQGVGRGYLHPDILRSRRARKHTPRPTRPARLVPAHPRFVTATRPWVPCAWRGWRPHGIVAPPGTGARHANPVDPLPRPGLDSRLRLRPADPLPRGPVLRKLGLAR